MSNQRPVNLDLTSLKFPPTAIISILHRISGVILFLLLPLVIYCFGLSIGSAETFARLCASYSSPYYKLGIWIFSGAFVFHVLAGVRHILMDLGLGEHLSSARKSASVLLGVATLLIIYLGFLIW